MQRGVMARAVRTGETQFIDDVRRDPDFLEATEGILAEVTVPFGVGSERSVQGATFGVASFPGDGRTTDDVLRTADRALYATKQESKARADAT